VQVVVVERVGRVERGGEKRYLQKAQNGTPTSGETTLMTTFGTGLTREASIIGRIRLRFKDTVSLKDSTWSSLLKERRMPWPMKKERPKQMEVPTATLKKAMAARCGQ
jgi:hypothetical protein